MTDRSMHCAQSINIAGAFISTHTEFTAIYTPRISQPWDGWVPEPRWREDQHGWT